MNNRFNILILALITLLVLVILMSIYFLIKNNRIKKKTMQIAKNVKITFYEDLRDDEFMTALLNMIHLKALIDKECKVDNKETMHKLIDEVYKEIEK